MVSQTLSSTLSVNPAFLQEIKDNHVDLQQTLNRVRELCELRLPQAEIAHDIVRLLNDLRDHLAFQFSLEEAYGYLEVPETDSDTALTAAEACRQHHSLYLEISDLCERAEELQYCGFAENALSRLIKETLTFDAKYQAHEDLEIKLIDYMIYTPVCLQAGVS